MMTSTLLGYGHSCEWSFHFFSYLSFLLLVTGPARALLVTVTPRQRQVQPCGGGRGCPWDPFEQTAFHWVHVHACAVAV